MFMFGLSLLSYNLLQNYRTFSNLYWILKFSVRELHNYRHFMDVYTNFYVYNSQSTLLLRVQLQVTTGNYKFLELFRKSFIDSKNTLVLLTVDQNLHWVLECLYKNNQKGGIQICAMVPWGAGVPRCREVPRSLEPCDGMLRPMVGHLNPKKSEGRFFIFA